MDIDSYTKLRDFQRQRVYNFEEKYLWNNKNVSKAILSKDNCKKLVQHIMFEHGMHHTLVVSFYDDDKAECTVDCDDVTAHINIPDQCRKAIVVIHEVAHILAAGDKHGDYFVVTYFDLLDKYLGIDFDYLVENSKRFKYNNQWQSLQVGNRLDVVDRVRESNLVTW